VFSVVGSRGGGVFITLVDSGDRDRERSQQQLQTAILEATRDIPGVRISTGGGGNPGSGPLQIQLTGDDSNVLAATAARLERELREVPGISNVTTSASLLQPEIVIRPQPERAAELGVTTEAISTAVRFATSGDVDIGLAKLNLPDRQVPIRVRLSDGARGDIERLRLLPVPGRGGAVPLVNVADM
jgi:multidrug efflux pump subunit AcrB